MSLSTSVSEYIKTSIIELKQVVWPTRQETISHTALVIGISLVMIVFLGVVDHLLAITLQTVLSL